MISFSLIYISHLLLILIVLKEIFISLLRNQYSLAGSKIDRYFVRRIHIIYV